MKFSSKGFSKYSNLNMKELLDDAKRSDDKEVKNAIKMLYDSLLYFSYEN